MKTKVRYWIPFKNEQDSFTNATNDEIKEETINTETKEPIQHDSKISVEQIWQQPPISQPLRCIGQIKLDRKGNQVNCMMDIGSTGTFMTHQCANRFRFKKKSGISAWW